MGTPVLLAWIASAIGAFAVGKNKGRPWEGLFLGMILAWFGLLIIACLPARRVAATKWMTGAQPLALPVAPQWAADPYLRHELRWWDGNGWTSHVSDQGLATVDTPAFIQPGAIVS